MCFCPIIAGCSCDLFAVSKLDKPIVKLHNKSMCITWDKVYNSKSYDVYCNNSKIETINSDSGINTYLYDFSTILDDEGDYKFSVKAVAGMLLIESSEKSNEVVYSHKSNTISTAPSVDIINKDSYNSIDLGVSVSGTKVTYSPVDDDEIDGYELYLYSVNNGYKVYPVTTSSIELQSSTFALKNEITAVRMGIVKNNKHLICSDTYYVNPDNYGKYTSNIYLFDGYINDHYIETLPEFKNIIYYSFISRIGQLDVKLSDEFVSEILSTYYGNSVKEKLANAVCVGLCDYLLETKEGNYEVSCRTINYNENTYSILVNYNSYLNKKGLPECEISYNPENKQTYDYTENKVTVSKIAYYPESNWLPYYETCGLIMRDEDNDYLLQKYDDFVSDKQFLYAEVSSSEELYWAVENKITPIVEYGSMAECIYNLAKNILNSIISDDMTDYEKALSIYDWICKNTIYDYRAIDDCAYKTTSNTLLPAFYLEGVFINGYAVCDGYSKAYSLMCNMEGIDAIRITGVASSSGLEGGHAWNKVLVDKDPEDGINAQYYIVDITWSAIVSSEDYISEEVSSHMYFLVSDNYISSSHIEWEGRPKYNNYYCESNYSYYEFTNFDYNGKRYNLVIDTTEEVDVLCDYMLHNALPSIEVVVDWEYIVENYNNIHPTIKYASYKQMMDALLITFNNNKFAEQKLIFNGLEYETTTYNNSGNKGVILIIEQMFLVGSQDAACLVIEYLSYYEIEGEFKFVVNDDIYNALTGLTPQEKLSSLFHSSLESHSNIGLTLNGGYSYNVENSSGQVIGIDYVFDILVEINA